MTPIEIPAPLDLLLKTKIDIEKLSPQKGDFIFVKIDIYRFDPESVKEWQASMKRLYPDYHFIFMDLSDAVEKIPKETLMKYLNQ